tara:strand:+ start:17755 stop:18225 length:471 start_codon:yes stop_codon:yes gene_type:complete
MNEMKEEDERNMRMIEMEPIQTPPLLDKFMHTVHNLGVPLPNLCQLDTDVPKITTPAGLAFLQEGWHYGCQMFVEHSMNPEEEQLEDRVAKNVDINCSYGEDDTHAFYLWVAWVDMKGYETGKSTIVDRDEFLRKLSRTMIMEGYKAFEADAEGGC